MKRKHELKLDEIDWRLIDAIEGGIPYSHAPYLEIANEIGISEREVMDRIECMCRSGIIRRFGVVVRHHELGYQSNAMVVWNIPDQHVQEFASQLLSSKAVHLCYRRPRKIPHWPYNLFCMIHGKDREVVLQQVEQLAKQYAHGNPEYNILFSKRRFKQRGMRYARKLIANTDDATGELAFG